VELRHLRYFRAVAEELHFGRAAERLHIAQPPLSHQIRQLERELGVELLTRSTRSVELTPAGQAYLERVVSILDAVSDAGEQAVRIASGIEGRLSIGCVGSATYSLLPELVRTLHTRLPDVEVRVRGEMLAPAQLSALLAGEIDLALLRPPVSTAGVSIETVRRDRLVVVLPEGHRLSERRQLRIDDLREEDFVVHAGRSRSVMNNLLITVCADAGFTPRIRHEVEETSTLVTMVAAGLGLAIAPHPTTALNIAGVCYRSMVPATLGIDLVAARTTARSPLIDNALACLRSIARSPIVHH
jgi:DNA-binding transcriptional LysR family regulator